MSTEHARAQAKRAENERKADNDKKSHQAAVKTDEAKQQDKDKDKGVFCWQDKEHRQHLSACLAAFPSELVNLIGSLLPVPGWSQERKSAGVVVSADATGLQRVARHHDQDWCWCSVISNQPLSPSSSSSSSSSPSPFPSSSSVAAFEVRVDCRGPAYLWLGVGDLPPDERVVGSEGLGVSYHSDGFVLINNTHACRDGEVIELAPYRAGAVIRMELDFIAKSVAFFNNGKLQDRPFDLSDPSKSGLDFSRPLYAGVTMCGPGDQVTML